MTGPFPSGGPAALPRFDSLLAAVRDFGGPEAVVLAQTAAPGGCINHGFTVTLQDGKRCFVKMNSRERLAMFQREAEGLAALRAAAAEIPSLRVPAPLSHGVDGEHSFLLLEHLESGPATDAYWEALGRSLAALHRGATATIFGFESDNFIGTTPQRNSWSDTWPDFFARCRLLPQLERARRQELASPALVRAVESIIERIDGLLPRLGQSSLVHGDLWSGNVLPVQAGGTAMAGLIDPAVYYGDPGVDLAMTELFGGFPDRFYRAYRELAEPGPHYEEARGLYDLYHLLNHLNIMGKSYAASALAGAQAYC